MLFLLKVQLCFSPFGFWFSCSCFLFDNFLLLILLGSYRFIRTGFYVLPTVVEWVLIEKWYISRVSNKELNDMRNKGFHFSYLIRLRTKKKKRKTKRKKERKKEIIIQKRIQKEGRLSLTN